MEFWDGWQFEIVIFHMSHAWLFVSDPWWIEYMEMTSTLIDQIFKTYFNQILCPNLILSYHFRY